MPISITNIGTGATSVSVPAGGVPVGAIVVVGTNDLGASIGGSVSDSRGNSYTRIAAVGNNNNVASDGFTALYYAHVLTALQSGDTINYTNVGTSSISASYLTGAGVLDSAATETGFGNGASVSLASGTPSVAGDLFIGWTGALTATASFSPSGSWAAPPNNSNNTPHSGGASLVNAAATAETFTGAWGVSVAWGAIVAAFTVSALGFPPRRIVRRFY